MCIHMYTYIFVCVSVCMHTYVYYVCILCMCMCPLEHDRQCFQMYSLSNLFLRTSKTSTVLQQKVENLESDLEAMKSTENLHNDKETSWNKVKQALENDLDSAETLLDKAKIQLETEQKLRYVHGFVYVYVHMYLHTYTCTYVYNGVRTKGRRGLVPLTNLLYIHN